MTDAEAKKKSEAIATELKHRFKARQPDFTPKWSREWVIPDNVLLPAQAKVEMQVKSKFPAKRPKADINVIQAWDKKHVPAVVVPPLKLRNKEVIQKNGTPPSHRFSHNNDIWDQFKKIEYHFECKIDQTTKQTQKALNVKRWHVIALDSDINKPPTQGLWNSSCVPMRDNFLTNLTGADDKAEKWEFPAHTTTLAKFGEKMKNTYTFVYIGHGAVMCRDCLGMYDCFTSPSEANRQAQKAKGDYRTDAERTAGIAKPGVVGGSFVDADFGIWTTCSKDGCTGSPRSTHCIHGWQAAPTPSFMDGTHISDEAICPTTAKYLTLSVCCGGAHETSLYDAYIGRGTRYCVGFKKAARGDWACDFTKSFFNTWAKTHKCDPAKIPEVFAGLEATWRTKLRPDLFGRARGFGSHLRNLGRQIAALF